MPAQHLVSCQGVTYCLDELKSAAEVDPFGLLDGTIYILEWQAIEKLTGLLELPGNLSWKAQQNGRSVGCKKGEIRFLNPS